RAADNYPDRGGDRSTGDFHSVKNSSPPIVTDRLRRHTKTICKFSSTMETVIQLNVCKRFCGKVFDFSQNLCPGKPGRCMKLRGGNMRSLQGRSRGSTVDLPTA